MADPGATPRSRTCQRLSGRGSETEPGRRSRSERDTRRRRPESSVAPGVRGAFCEALVRDALGVARVGDTPDSPHPDGPQGDEGPKTNLEGKNRWTVFRRGFRHLQRSALSRLCGVNFQVTPVPPAGPPAERYLPSVRGSRVALCEAPLLVRVSSAAPLPTGGPSPSPGSAWSP